MKPIKNPPSPYQSAYTEYFEGIDPPAELHIYEDATRNILSENKSPDLGFRWSLNPYRGCTHGCSYCYARPTHEYLDFGSGTDFETKILVKPRAAELLRERFMKKSWKGEFIVFSGDTDPYQPLEANYHLTRQCLDACLEFGNPAGIITKSFLITRDIDLLRKLHARTHLWVVVSIPFIENKTARLVEPGAASIGKRFEAVKMLSDAGLDVSVNIAPVIPGLNDSEMVQIMKRAKACGAKTVSMILLRLPGNVKAVFEESLRKHFPLAADKILERMKQTRGGVLYKSHFGERFSGKGNYWENIERTFKVYRRKLDLHERPEEKERPPFKRPTPQQEFAF